MLSSLFISTSFAQIRTFKWTDELCEYSGTYDGKKYNEVKLRNTHRLLFGHDLQLESVGATVWKYEDIAKQDPAAVEAKYKDLIDELEHFEYVSTPFTDAVLASKLRETRQLYQLIRTTMTAYHDPLVIRKYEGHPALRSSNTRTPIWNVSTLRKNGVPRRARSNASTRSVISTPGATSRSRFPTTTSATVRDSRRTPWPRSLVLSSLPTSVTKSIAI